MQGQASIGAEGSRHTKRWTATVASQAQIDVKYLLRDDDLVDLLSVRSEEFNRLIKNLSNDVLDRIERQTLGSIFEGRGQADIAKSLQEIEGIGRNRARLIARDQASKLNGAMNQFRQEQAGITHYKWKTVLDGRERPSHNANNNKIFSWNKPPQSTGHPGHEVNCFPGSTRVTLANGCHKLWRRNYVGALVSIETGDGARLEATPNHPVLTSRGWLAINDLQEGDYVVKAALDRGVVVENDERHLEVSLHDLFEAVALREGFHSARSAPSDFHGDGIEGDIDAVLIQGFLPSRGKAERDEAVENLLLAGANGDVGVTALNARGPLTGGPDKMRSGQRSDPSMSRGRQCAALDLGHLAHADIHGAASGAASDIMFCEQTIDNRATYAEFGSNGLFANTASVLRDDVSLGECVDPVRAALAAIDRGVISGMPSAECIAECVTTATHNLAGFGSCGPVVYERLRVVQKSVREFSGHVYNLETSTSWFIARSLVVHNCRCRGLAVITDDPEDLAELPEVPGGDFFDENLPALRQVGPTPSQGVFGFEPEQIAERLAQTRQLQANVGAVGREFTELHAERLVIELYGFKPSDDDLRGLLSGFKNLTASRRTVLIEAAKSRLEMTERLLLQARVNAGGELFEGAAQETVAAKSLPNDGFASVPPAQVTAQLKIAENLPSLDRRHFDTYSEYGYRIINKYARDGVITEIKAGKLVAASDPQITAAMVERIAQTIQARTYGNVLPAETVLYRGIGTTHHGRNILTPGYTWRDATFTSASRDLRAATEFYDNAKEPVMLVLYGGGKRGLPIERIAQFGYEKEIILPAGTSFRVRSVETGIKRGLLDKARTYVHVDIISQTESISLGGLRQSAAGSVPPSKAFFRAGDVTAKPLDVAASRARREILAEGRASGNEIAAAYDANGRSLGVWSSGEADRLSLSPVAELRNAKQSITVHHTHPSSSSFSRADYVAFDLNPGMARLYAHGHDGSDYIVERVSSRSISGAVNRAYEAARKASVDLVLSGADDIAIDKLMHHAMGMALDRAGVVNYRAELSSGLKALQERNQTLVNDLATAIFDSIR